MYLVIHYNKLEGSLIIVQLECIIIGTKEISKYN